MVENKRIRWHRIRVTTTQMSVYFASIFQHFKTHSDNTRLSYCNSVWQNGKWTSLIGKVGNTFKGCFGNCRRPCNLLVHLPMSSYPAEEIIFSQHCIIVPIPFLPLRRQLRNRRLFLILAAATPLLAVGLLGPLPLFPLDLEWNILEFIGYRPRIRGPIWVIWPKQGIYI